MEKPELWISRPHGAKPGETAVERQVDAIIENYSKLSPDNLRAWLADLLLRAGYDGEASKFGQPPSLNR